MSNKRDFPKIENKILLSLPGAEYEKIFADLEPIPLSSNRTLFQAGERINHAYFINTGIVSLIAGSRDGGSVEIGVVGNEGILALQAMVGNERMLYRALVQIPGEALRITGADLRRHFHVHGVLCNQLLRFWQLLDDHIYQRSVCNRFHTFEQRLCRWLLVTADRVDKDDLPLTHEFLSLVLGANRATVTLTVGALKKAGLISHRRSSIRILDRKRMEMAACECYQIYRRRFEDYLQKRQSAFGGRNVKIMEPDGRKAKRLWT